jgi:hypothetical protein
MNVGVLLGAATAIGLASRAGSDDVVREIREQNTLLRDELVAQRPRQRQYPGDKYIEMMRANDPDSAIPVWLPEHGPAPDNFKGIIRDRSIPLETQRRMYLHPEQFSEI